MAPSSGEWCVSSGVVRPCLSLVDPASALGPLFCIAEKFHWYIAYDNFPRPRCIILSNMIVIWFCSDFHGNTEHEPPVVTCTAYFQVCLAQTHNQHLTHRSLLLVAERILAQSSVFISSLSTFDFTTHQSNAIVNEGKGKR